MSIVCQVCGTANPDGTQFCEGCGVELKNAAASNSAASASDPATPPVPAMADAGTAPAGTELAGDLTSGAASAGSAPVAPSDFQSSELSSAPTPPASTELPPLPDLSAPVIPDAPAISAAPSTPVPTSDSGDLNSDLQAPAPTPSAQPVGDAPAPAAEPVATADPVAPSSSVLTSEGADVVSGMADLPPATPPAGDVSAPVPPESAGDTVQGELAPAPVSTDPATPMGGTPARSGAAKLGVKKFGTASGDFIPLQGERLIVGRFDPSSGPVDIDLSGIQGAEHISRHHAELYREGGQWFVRDLGSTNGVFVKRQGQSGYSPRLQEPAALSDGDELAFGNLMLSFHQD